MPPRDVDGLNAGYASLLLDEYLEDPDSVPPEWRAVFERGGIAELVAQRPGLGRLLEAAGDGAAVETPSAQPTNGAGAAAPPPQPAAVAAPPAPAPAAAPAPVPVPAPAVD